MSTLGRVLVVDDDRDIVESITIRLHAAGYEVMASYDGQQGIAAAVQHQPDAILLDVRMPKMDGMAVLAQLGLHRETQDIPVIMLSASMINQQAALRAGASYFIVKPYESTNLLAALNSAIRDRASAEITPARPERTAGSAKVDYDHSSFVTRTPASTERSP